MDNCNKSRGVTKMVTITKNVIKITPAPVGLPLAASAFMVNSLPLSLGNKKNNFGRKYTVTKKPVYKAIAMSTAFDCNNLRFAYTVE